MITTDYDVDGFVDLVVANGLLFYPVSRGGSDRLIRNTAAAAGNTNHWIQIDLDGVTSNRSGIGAKVFATAGGVTQLREQNGGYHRWSQNDQRIHFGLGTNTSPNTPKRAMLAKPMRWHLRLPRNTACNIGS